MTRPAGGILAELAERAAQDRLALFGLCHTEAGDGLGDGTLALLGPAEPGFWRHYTASPEYRDGTPDPMDRWSARVIAAMAKDLGGQALFPFGTPHQPFISWAIRGGCHVSPVSLLVHPDAGLFVSFRGAIHLPDRLPLPDPLPNPCDTCTGRPCLTACPPRALTDDGYDLDACHAYLDTGPGQRCLSQGCAVRRVCPAGATYQRAPDHSAYHMEQFHPCPSP